MANTFERARAFIYRNARPVDLARWQYHFENGSKDAVLDALAHYQNDDGGFGHALEPDAWNPNSSPIQTWTATEILREIDFTDTTHPIFNGILKYLESGQDFDGELWYNEIVSNNNYPHAPWWGCEQDNADSYNPTACLAGFIIRFAEKGGALYGLGVEIAKKALIATGEKGLSRDMHSVNLYIRLLEYCQEACAADIIDISSLEKRLHELIPLAITQDTAEWEKSYVCKPSQFFHSKDSIFYAENKKIAEYECEFIVRTQSEDGAWNIPWGWGAYPDEWAISKRWWQSNGILVNMLYLKGMGKI